MFVLVRNDTHDPLPVAGREDTAPDMCPAQECAHPEIHAVLQGVEEALEAQKPGFGFGGKTQEPDGGG